MTSITLTFPSFPAGPGVLRDRSMALALIGSAVVHALLAIAIAMRLVALPESQPVPGPATGVRAVLQYTPRPDRPVVPEPIERLAAPTLGPLLVPLSLPEPAARTAAVPRSGTPAPVTGAPTTARIEPRVVEPNGSVTVGVLTDALQIGPAFASAVADRYRVHPDRVPRLTAAVIVPYPSVARRSRTSARISALLDIDERGHITGTQLMPDDGTFAPVVIEALKEARFTPAEVATHPVPYWAVLEFDFAISAR